MHDPGEDDLRNEAHELMHGPDSEPPDSVAWLDDDTPTDPDLEL